MSITGNDERGVLFGAGRLLREMRMEPRRATIADDLSLAAVPEYPLRGHQLGHRPKANPYDGWTLALREWAVHAPREKGYPMRPVEFSMPRTATADGAVTLKMGEGTGWGTPRARTGNR